MLISQQNHLNEFCTALRERAQSGAPLSFDTEFVSEKRYFAQLCLVQVHMPAVHGHFGPLEAAIDPFHLDLTPLVQLIADKDVNKIVHAGSVDLHILWTAFGAAARNVFDTQIAAAFLGFGHQIGYADLVRRITGIGLSKTMQYSDWAVRPLSEEQIEYALSDVRHLPPVYNDLRNNLERRGRQEWARSEFHRAEERAAFTERDSEAYKKLNLAGLKRLQLAVLREVAILREVIARDIDKPPSFIVPDLALVQMVRQAPTSVGQLRAIRGMPAISNDYARKFLETLETAKQLPPESWPPARPEERPDPRLDSIVSLLGVVAGARATSHDVSRSYLAPREQVATLAGWWLKKHAGIQEEDPEIPLLTDWRAELLGNDLMRLLGGELVVAMDINTGLPELKDSPVSLEGSYALPFPTAE